MHVFLWVYTWLYLIFTFHHLVHVYSINHNELLTASALTLSLSLSLILVIRSSRVSLCSCEQKEREREKRVEVGIDTSQVIVFSPLTKRDILRHLNRCSWLISRERESTKKKKKKKHTKDEDANERRAAFANDRTYRRQSCLSVSVKEGTSSFHLTSKYWKAR